MTRAVEQAGTRWLVLAGTLVGLAFLTKMLQAFLVLPAFALVYLVAAPTTLRRRLLDLLGAPAAAVVVSAGWWVALVELWPAGVAPLHRRLDQQQRARAGARLQRPQPPHRRLRAGARAAAADRAAAAASAARPA